MVKTDFDKQKNRTLFSNDKVLNLLKNREKNHRIPHGKNVGKYLRKIKVFHIWMRNFKGFMAYQQTCFRFWSLTCIFKFILKQMSQPL